MQESNNIVYQGPPSNNIVVHTQPGPGIYVQPGNIVIQTHQQHQQPQYSPQYASSYPPQYASSQQQIIISSQPAQREWSHGLMNCGDDCLDCLFAHYCRLCYAVQLGSMHNEHCCTIFCCGLAALIPLRTKIRAERNIQGSICKDILVMTCCEPCALIQMKKETVETPNTVIGFAPK